MTTTLQSNLTRPLALKQGSSEVSILVPADVWVAAEQLREEFLLSSTAESASAPAEEGAEDQAPEMALVARFLKFATDKSEQVNWWLRSSLGDRSRYTGESIQSGSGLVSLCTVG